MNRKAQRQDLRNIVESAGLGLMGLVMVVTGVRGLFFPQSLFTPLGVMLGAAPAMNEIRAMYGGAHLLLGLLLMAAVFRHELRLTGLWVMLLWAGGLLLGRILSFALDGFTDNFLILQFVISEIIAIAIAGRALWRRYKQRAAGAQTS